MSSYEARNDRRSEGVRDILFRALVGLTFIGSGTWLGLSVYASRTALLVGAVATIGLLLTSAWRLKLLRRKTQSPD